MATKVLRAEKANESSIFGALLEVTTRTYLLI
jgi:hypothetical protein